MNNYTVKIEQTSVAIVNIKAEDEFEAEDIALDMWGSAELEQLFQHDVQVIVED